MACGVPCVVTAAGDSALIVGNAGVVVPPKNPRALADGWTKLLELLPEPRRLLGEQARARVMRQFGRAMLVQKTSEALMQCLGNTITRL
jgi:glycosyltransferase involved in cell wall biosynthesis